VFETIDAGFLQPGDGQDAETKANELRRDKLNHGSGPPRFFRQHDFNLSQRRGGDDAKLKPEFAGRQNSFCRF